jgi:hypothetical protein
MIPATSSGKAGKAAASFPVLVLSEKGKVLTANAAAKSLWQTGGNELIGEAFPGLISIEVT